VNCDKKKSELYFVSLVKKILTEISCEDGHFFRRNGRRARLTEPLPSRIIFLSTEANAAFVSL
jgi:hypothetical protein